MRRIAKDEYLRYFPISQRDQQWDLYVTGVGRIVHARPGTPDRAHPAPYYYVWESGRVLGEFGVLYITQGEGEFESQATGRQSVGAGMVVLLFPGVWHRYRPREQTYWTYYWAHFGGGYPERLVGRKFISPQRPILKTGLDETLLRSYVALLERARSEPPGFQQLMAGNIVEILGAALAAARGQGTPKRLNALARKATLILQQRTESEVDTRQMKRLAASLGLSYDRFRHVFKEHTGLGPHQYHLQLRIRRAKELLCGTDLSIKEVSAVLKFEDPYYFSKAFKKKTGTSPSQWRKAAQLPDGPPPADDA